ncbi:MAG: DNA repair protein RecN [Candidatus Neomarinimicrobiota bacterium]
MLTRLCVKNYALIENLDVTFGTAFSVLTGATGAGKSILIGSMNLILGEKASLEMIRSGTKEAFVEATFEFESPPPEPVRRFLSQGSNVLLLKRQVVEKGRSFAFANDQKITLATLKDVGIVLADLLGQHHHQSLLNPNIHRELLDRFSLDTTVLRDYGETFFRLKKCEQELKETLEQEQLSKERQELYRFQMDEVDKAELQPGERASLREERKVLQNARKIISTAQRISHGLSGEDESALNRLKILLREFESLAELDTSLEDKVSQWKDAVFSLEDLAFDLARYSDSVQADPVRLEWVEDRLRLYSDFAKKYGVSGSESSSDVDSYDAIMNYRDRIEKELKNLENREDRIEKLKGKVESLKAEVFTQGQAISKERAGGAKILKQKIEEELRELGMKGTKFDVQFTPLSQGGSTAEVVSGKKACYAGETGLEDVEFSISPNPGEPLKPLARIASGGEISRIMLALKTVLAKVDNIPLLVFDEIDVGIGGEIASLVGKKLRKLSRSHQIICITHLQQIASQGDHHFRVFKTQKGDRTITKVKVLSQEERVEEIARMIAGEQITDLSLEHAREFLDEAARAQG